MRNTNASRLWRVITRFAAVSLLAAAVAGCSGTAGSNGSTDGNGDDGSESRSTSPTTCPGGCPDGQFCYNGLCAVGCNSDKDCAENQYCATDTDRLCHNKEVQECSSDSDCSGEQVCNKGLCAAQPEQSEECEPKANGKDGCGEYAVCIEEEGGNSCYTLPKCSEDGTCPTGQAGAVCNDGYLRNKADICLLGLCEDASNCPEDWTCERFNEDDVLGYCSNRAGETGSPCEKDSDCDSGNCQGSDMPGPGVCE